MSPAVLGVETGALLVADERGAELANAPLAGLFQRHQPEVLQAELMEVGDAIGNKGLQRPAGGDRPESRDVGEGHVGLVDPDAEVPTLAMHRGDALRPADDDDYVAGAVRRAEQQNVGPAEAGA